VQTQFGEGVGRFSPDGNWVAYQSTESGEWAVYVRPFDGSRANGNATSAGRWRISIEDGAWPVWRGDGKEIFYLHRDDRIMAVEVKTGRSRDQLAFETGIPRKLFDVRAYGLLSFTVTPDGQRFLVNTKIGEEKSPSVSVILNWPALLKRSGK
jgi:Tol biopolymer transport system component